MRWIDLDVKMRRFYENNSTRIIKRFLIIPRKIKDEYRWLEFVKIKQNITQEKRVTDMASYYYEYVWTDLEWID